MDQYDKVTDIQQLNKLKLEVSALLGTMNEHISPQMQWAPITETNKIQLIQQNYMVIAVPNWERYLIYITKGKTIFINSKNEYLHSNLGFTLGPNVLKATILDVMLKSEPDGSIKVTINDCLAFDGLCTLSKPYPKRMAVYLK
jgi:redox-sensitive bicupin YhaK (pirin superfamily)